MAAHACRRLPIEERRIYRPKPDPYLSRRVTLDKPVKGSTFAKDKADGGNLLSIDAANKKGSLAYECLGSNLASISRSESRSGRLQLLQVFEHKRTRCQSAQLAVRTHFRQSVRILAHRARMSPSSTTLVLRNAAKVSEI